MMMIGGLLIYLAVARKFEPLLLVPIGFGAILSNIPVAGIAGEQGLLGYIYHVGIETGVFPLLIFMGVGALTDFGALIAMPSTLILGAAAQFGIFVTLLGALALNLVPGFDFTLADASAIAIIGGADDQVGLSATRRAALGQRLACMERLKIRVDFAALERQQRVRSGIERRRIGRMISPA